MVFKWENWWKLRKTLKFPIKITDRNNTGAQSIMSVEQLAIKQGLLAQLKQRRQELKFDQTKLGQLSGLSQSTISQVEKGDKDLSLESLFRVCEALGLEIKLIKKDDTSVWIKHLVNFWMRILKWLS